jgi:hypothetical protein
MKKTTNWSKVIMLSFTLVCSHLSAQTTVTIPSANPAGTGSIASAARKPLGTNRAYERSAMIYKHSDLGQQGIISALGFFVDSLNAPGDAITRIFLKEVPDSTMTPTTVAAVETGATLVFDDTIPASAFQDSAWITIQLSTVFAHATNNNLMVIVETNSGGTAGSDINTISKGFRYFATTGNAFQYWQSATGSGAIPTGNGTLNLNRPNIQFEISSLPPCPAPPSAGITIASDDSICSGETVIFSLSGSSIGSGISYQWLTSADGVSWSIINGEINPNLIQTISTAAYYACEITCSGLSDTSSVSFIYLNTFYECYCTANIGGNCTSAIDSVAISTTTLANGPTACTLSYSSYPQTGNTTASLTQGLAYNLVTRFTGDTRTSLWIDYNQNGVFEPAEWTQVCTTSVAGADVTASFVVPFTALTGTTGMRIRSRAAAGVNDSTTACANFGTGETEDYLIDILSASACVAPPTAGNVIASNDSVCSGEQVNLSLLGNTTGAGISFQWLSSSDGISFIDVLGADLPFYNPIINANSYFACVVTCSGVSDTTLPVSVTLNSFLDCYCKLNLGGDCATTALDSLAIITTTLANGPTGCAPTFYTAYPNASNTTADLMQGQTYDVISRYNGPVRSSIWIDYNQNGVFETTEWTLVTTTATAGADVNSTLNIPLNASLGLTGMRVRTRATNGLNDATQACATFGSGETEDYIINIVAAPVCTTPPVAGTALADQDTVCAGEIVNYSLTGINNLSGQTFQWISSNDGISWTDVAGANGLNITATIEGDTLFACVVTCSGISDTSVAANVFVNSFLDCYCTTGLGGNCAISAIDSVAIVSSGFFNGPTGCSAGNYAAYPVSGNTTVDLNINWPYQLLARFNGDTRTSLWIDYDHSGTYDVNEWVQVCTTSIADTNVLVGFTIPQTALTGLTGMRIRSRVTAGVNDSTTACANFGTGEIEDYVINILPEIVGLNANVVNNFTLFPNPNIGQFQLKSSVNIQDVVVYDLAGRRVNAAVSLRNPQLAEINIAEKGLYFIQLRDVNQQLSTQRVVVK